MHAKFYVIHWDGEDSCIPLWPFRYMRYTHWQMTSLERTTCPSLPPSSNATEGERSPPPPPSLLLPFTLLILWSYPTLILSPHLVRETFPSGSISMPLLKGALWLFPGFWAKFQMLNSSNMNVRSLFSIYFIWLMSPQLRSPPHQHSFGSSYANEHSPISLPSLWAPLCAKLMNSVPLLAHLDEFKRAPWTSGLISEKQILKYAIHPQPSLPRASTLVFPTWSS